MKKKIVILNIISSLLQQFGATIYGLIVPILLIKEFGSEVNGLVSSINQFISYITLLEFGIGPVIKAALYKPLSEKNETQIKTILGTASKFFKNIAYVFIGYIIILCLIFPSIVTNFDKLYLISLIVVISIGRFFEYFLGMTYKLFFQAEQKNYIFDFVVLITYIISIIIIYILIKLNCSIHIVKLIGSLIHLIRPLTLKLYFQKKYNLKFIHDKNYKLPQKWDGIFHQVASIVQSNTDVVILTIFSNLINVSIYSVYALVNNGIKLIIMALTNGIDAFFGKMLVSSETTKINKNFKIYKFFFYSITTILISCTIVLIIPFISVYTRDITDVNYINEAFAYILILGEFVFVIRYPYSTVVYAKGHFKQTRTFSIIEPIVNIIISTILVIKYDIIGVAIGTLISMFIRTFGFIIYCTKNILQNKLRNELKIIITSTLQLLIIFLIHLYFGNIKVNNYIDWFKYATIISSIISIFIISTNALIYKDTVKQIKAKVINKKAGKKI